MHPYPSAVPLLEKWEEYVRMHPAGNLEHFGAWLQKKSQSSQEVSAHAARSTVYLEQSRFKNNPLTPYKVDYYAGYLIGRLYKFVRFYMKPLLYKAGFSNIEEFGFLASLRELKESNKKELIEANLSEFTTGLDIIRRLVKNGLIAEKPHPEDGRAKLLLITAKGEEALQKLSELFSQLPQVLPQMSEAEKESLIETLEYLDRYHTTAVEKYR